MPFGIDPTSALGVALDKLNAYSQYKPYEQAEESMNALGGVLTRPGFNRRGGDIELPQLSPEQQAMQQEMAGPPGGQVSDGRGQQAEAAKQAEMAAWEQGVRERGMTVSAPGVAYSMPQPGPRETRSAFGKSYEAPVGGGVSSRMDISPAPGGSTPALDRQRGEAMDRNVQSMRYGTMMGMGGMDPKEYAGVMAAERSGQQPDPTFQGIQMAQQLEQETKAVEDQAERTLLAEAAAMGPKAPKVTQAMIARAKAESLTARPDLQRRRQVIEQIVTQKSIPAFSGGYGSGPQ